MCREKELLDALDALADLETSLVNLNLLTNEYRLIFKQLNEELENQLMEETKNEPTYLGNQD